MTVNVVPHAGTWIEIFSLSSLKSHLCVVPHAGTWIEINRKNSNLKKRSVVPHAGTWIEIKFAKMQIGK